jgi:GNAT superfamily N-acetyltransferase
MGMHMTAGQAVGGVRLERLTGQTLRQRLEDLARLRIEVFRAFPYLYDGDLAYEQRYLETYLRSQDSALIAAFDEDRVVGAATALPLADETDNLIAPFRRHGFEIERVFYFGESVLLPAFRGRGIGVAFFEEREAWARSLGRFSIACFCAVDRPADHPRRPKDYVPLDAFWERRGFRRVPDMTTRLSWKDLDEAEESPKRMAYWMKTLAP